MSLQRQISWWSTHSNTTLNSALLPCFPILFQKFPLFLRCLWILRNKTRWHGTWPLPTSGYKTFLTALLVNIWIDWTTCVSSLMLKVLIELWELRFSPSRFCVIPIILNDCNILMSSINISMIFEICLAIMVKCCSLHRLMNLMRNRCNNATVGRRYYNIGIWRHLALVFLAETGTSELRIVPKHPRWLPRQARTCSCHHIMVLNVWYLSVIFNDIRFDMTSSSGWCCEPPTSTINCA